MRMSFVYIADEAISLSRDLPFDSIYQVGLCEQIVLKKKCFAAAKTLREEVERIKRL